MPELIDFLRGRRLGGMAHDHMHHAADEIERLTAELAIRDEANKQLAEIGERQHKEIAVLNEQIRLLREAPIPKRR